MELAARRRRAVRRAVTYVLLALWAVIVLFPFYWMVLTSVKSYSAYSSERIPAFFTLSPTLQNYRDAFTAVPLGRYFLNTVIFTAVSYTHLDVYKRQLHLHAVAVIIVAQRTAAQQDVQRLAGDGLAQGLLALLRAQMGQQVGDHQLGLITLADADIHHGAVTQDHGAPQLQRNGDPLVLADAAVVMGLEAVSYTHLNIRLSIAVIKSSPCYYFAAQMVQNSFPRKCIILV